MAFTDWNCLYEYSYKLMRLFLCKDSLMLITGKICLFNFLALMPLYFSHVRWKSDFSFLSC